MIANQASSRAEPLFRRSERSRRKRIAERAVQDNAPILLCELSDLAVKQLFTTESALARAAPTIL